jgi:hypothetical protein
MRRLGFLLIILATTFPVLGEDWNTADGKTYRNVKVIVQEDDGVRVTYTGGVGIIPYYELSLELRKRFGEDYDTLEAKRIAAEKALAEAIRSNTATAAELQKLQDAVTAARIKALAAASAQQEEAQATTQPDAQPRTQPTAQATTQSGVQPSAQSDENTQSAQPLANPPAPPVEDKNPYPGSKFSYDEALDVCYLDSPAVDVFLVLPDAAPLAPNSPGQGKLTLRITTDGHKPETPDQIEATFVSAVPIKKSADNSHIKFLVDGTYLYVDEIKNTDGDASSDTGQSTENITFYLAPQQAKTIVLAKNVNFSVGNTNYRIDHSGIFVFRKYFVDVDSLPPTSTNFLRSFHKFVAGIPSIITVISTVCEYIILGSFTIIVAASIAAFVMGVGRFIKM